MPGGAGWGAGEPGGAGDPRGAGDAEDEGVMRTGGPRGEEWEGKENAGGDGLERQRCRECGESGWPRGLRAGKQRGREGRAVRGGREIREGRGPRRGRIREDKRIERAGNPSREGSLQSPVQRARDAARLGVEAGKKNAGGKEGPGMQGMWPCGVRRGRGGKGRSKGSGIQSHAGDATYRERGRAGVREGKGVQGIRKGQGIKLRRECGRGGVWKEQEQRRV